MKKAQTKTTEKVKKVPAAKVAAKKEVAPKAKGSAKSKAPKAEMKAQVVAEKKENGANDKTKIITEFAVKANDTGSPEVQIALLSTRIGKLTSHLEQNKKDNHSRRGLLGLISKRRRLLIYLQGKDEKRYNELTKKLNLKK